MVELSEKDIFNIYREATKDFNRAFELVEVRSNKYSKDIFYLVFKMDSHRFLPPTFLSKLSKIANREISIAGVDSDKETLNIEIWLM